MTVVSALLLICVAVKVTLADDLECQNIVSCPCGNTGSNVMICADRDTEVCTRLSKCKKCKEGSDICSECPEGFEGPICSQATVKKCEIPEPMWKGKFQFFHPTIKVEQEMKSFPPETLADFSCPEGYKLVQNYSLTCKTCPTCDAAWWAKLGSERPECKIECGRGFLNYGPCNLKNCNRHAPWVVSISVEDDNGVNHVCLGALLTHQTILTAAHCLVGNRSFVVHFGKHGKRYGDDNPEVIVRNSSRIILHPDFSNTTFDSNIGLLIFEPKIRFTEDVQPICLHRYSIERNNIGTTGIVSVTNGVSDAYPKGNMALRRMTILSEESCLEANKQAGLFITKNSICAGNKDDLQTVCDGDSGAPLFFYSKYEDSFRLLSIVSYPTRDTCAIQGGNYAMFTNLGKFVDWIYEHLK